MDTLHRNAAIAIASLLLVASGVARAELPKGPVPLSATLTFDRGTVSDGKSVVLTVASQFPDGLTEGHQVSAPGKGIVFAVNMMKSNGTKLAAVEFPALNRTFEARFPGDTTIVTLLQSYVKNGVLVGNRASLEGLTAYCAQRGIALKDTRALMAREAAAAQRVQCGECRDAYRACQVQRAWARQHPRPGVTVENAANSCERRYRACSFGGEMYLSGPHAPRADEWPCGPIAQ